VKSRRQGKIEGKLDILIEYNVQHDFYKRSKVIAYAILVVMGDCCFEFCFLHAAKDWRIGISNIQKLKRRLSIIQKLLQNQQET